ncbi:MAG: type II toxin-antitoxin system RelE/ParE family toxin [Dolichospermum sp.]|jgi:toxin ParE1/3/4
MVNTLNMTKSQFRISSQAAKDIENIWKYVAQNNSKATDKLFDILRSTFPKLAKYELSIDN